ncbi:hypothetical protein, partial [Heyndrickxia coagulans]|uniref:hypothetical protein n=1 Tax=Heyndrickxia coagulans TaxID=1398 RepID=UPI00214DC0CA
MEKFWGLQGFEFWLLFLFWVRKILFSVLRVPGFWVGHFGASSSFPLIAGDCRLVFSSFGWTFLVLIP